MGHKVEVSSPNHHREGLRFYVGDVLRLGSSGGGRWQALGFHDICGVVYYALYAYTHALGKLGSRVSSGAGSVHPPPYTRAQVCKSAAAHCRAFSPINQALSIGLPARSARLPTHFAFAGACGGVPSSSLHTPRFQKPFKRHAACVRAPLVARSSSCQVWWQQLLLLRHPNRDPPWVLLVTFAGRQDAHGSVCAWQLGASCVACTVDVHLHL